MKDWMWLDETIDLSDQQMAFLHAFGNRGRVWSFTPGAGKYDPYTMRRWQATGGGVEVEIGAAQDRDSGQACKFDDGKVIEATPVAALLDELLDEGERRNPYHFIMQWDIMVSEKDFIRLEQEMGQFLTVRDRKKFRQPTYRGHRVWQSPDPIAPRLVRNPLFGLDIGLKPAFSTISVTS